MSCAKASGAAMANARATYVMELARGASHINSTLTPETCKRAIAEIFAEFGELHGNRELGLFQKLLVEDLHRRGNRDAASAVADFKFTG
jgi:hypothetical protein